MVTFPQEMGRDHSDGHFFTKKSLKMGSFFYTTFLNVKPFNRWAPGNFYPTVKEALTPGVEPKKHAWAGL